MRRKRGRPRLAECRIVPGSAYGPCVALCEHPRCAQARQLAESLCAVCGGRVGFDVGFRRRTLGVVHSGCDSRPGAPRSRRDLARLIARAKREANAAAQEDRVRRLAAAVRHLAAEAAALEPKL
jgi:hypothetical protein